MNLNLLFSSFVTLRSSSTEISCHWLPPSELSAGCAVPATAKIEINLEADLPRSSILSHKHVFEGQEARLSGSSSSIGV